MKIGNIIFENELVNHTKVDYINYFNEELSYNDLIDKSLPTLYVGWIFMKVCNLKTEFIKNIDILNKVISDNLKWEFSFEENKSAHIKGVEDFVKNLPEQYFSPKYTYINLDPVFFQLRDFQDLIDVLPKSIDSYYNFKNEMIYLLVDNKITGINLKMFEFFKFNINDIIMKISERTKEVFNDVDGEIYKEYYQIFPEFTFLKRYLISMLKK
jgi:hypothetical protein